MLVSAVAILALPSGAGAKPKPKPDLKVTSVSLSRVSVPGGQALRVTNVVKNTGKRRAKASTTGYFLSRDPRRSGDDRRLSESDRLAFTGTKALPRGATAFGGTRPTMPDVANGPYYLLACADVKAKVRERKEGNNCLGRKVTKTATIRVTGVTPALICAEFPTRVTVLAPGLSGTVEEVYAEPQTAGQGAASFSNLIQVTGQVTATIDFQGAPPDGYDITVRDSNYDNLAVPLAGALRTVPCSGGPLTGMNITDGTLPASGGTIEITGDPGSFQSGARVILALDDSGNAFDAATSFDSSSQLTATVPGGGPSAFEVYVINPDGSAGYAGSVSLI